MEPRGGNQEPGRVLREALHQLAGGAIDSGAARGRLRTLVKFTNRPQKH
jgi:hypothetical protein